MATNKVQDGKILRLTVGSTIDSGDHVVVGNAFRGVALTDYDSADGKASIEMGPAVYDLSVTATDDAGNTTIAIGDRLYTDGTTITKKKSGKFFGIALEANSSSGSTATINVYIPPPNGPDRASHQIFAAGIHTVDDSPLAATEFIGVTGIAATDVVLCTLHTNGGSPDLYIISATAAASPAGITVTASGTFTAGDKINYAVLRASL
jgi:predicted RecA/RadA family phage recombinase